MKRRNCAPNTVKNYLNIIKHFVIWVDVPVEERDAYNSISHTLIYLMRKRLAPKTVNCHVNGIRQFYHYLKEEEGFGHHQSRPKESHPEDVQASSPALKR